MNYFLQICSLFIIKIAIKRFGDCLLDEMHICHNCFTVRLLICYFNGYYHINYDFSFQVHLHCGYYLDMLLNVENCFNTNSWDVSNYYLNAKSYLFDYIIDVFIYCKVEEHLILN